MKDYKKIEDLKSNYMNIEIPDELECVVNDAFNIHHKKSKRKNISRLSTLAASIVLIVGIVNLNPTLASALDTIPVIGSIVKVINFKNYKIDENGYDVSIDVPKIEGLKDKDLEDKINKEFEQEGKELYNEYLNEMKELKERGIEGKQLGKSWYEVKTDNENILSIVIYNHYAQGSSNTTRKIYNVDKKNQTILTLNGMFKESDYVDVISENIKDQMRLTIEENPEKSYWIDREEGFFEFEKIDKDQTFYINDNNEIVICFDKYDVAPGSQGLVEFVIPREVTDKLLVK